MRKNPSPSKAKPKAAAKAKPAAAEICRGYEVRIYPSPEQAQKLSQWIGACRFVWNWAIRVQAGAYASCRKKPGDLLMSELLTELRKQPGKEWLNEVPRECLQQVLRFNQKSWKKFFKDIAEGKKAHAPRSHGKRGSDAIRFPIDKRRVAQTVRPQSGLVVLTSLGEVNARFSETLLGELASITVKGRAGKWFAVITATNIPFHQGKHASLASGLKKYTDVSSPGGIVAVDFGVATRATASDGTILPHTKVSEKKRKGKLRCQRRFARKQREKLKEMGLDPNAPIPKGTRVKHSKRAQRELHKVAQFDLAELFSRKDAIHKYTTYLVQNYHTIVVETLELHGMMQTLSRGFRRRAHSAAMGEILRQLEYKCEWYGRRLIKVDRWFPSSKRCSGCGEINKELKLSHREWQCPSCGANHDRDKNAAINLWQEGVRMLQAPSLTCSTAGSAGSHARRGKESVSPSHRQRTKGQRDAKPFLLQAVMDGMEPSVTAVG